MTGSVKPHEDPRKAAYESSWGEAFCLLVDLISANPHLSLAEAQSKIIDDHTRKNAVESYSGYLHSFGHRYLLSRPVDSHLLQFYFNSAKQSLLSLLCSASPNIDWVLELGSGLGNNLFTAWNSLLPLSTRLYGYEYTYYGRATSKLLASLERRLTFTSESINFKSVSPGFFPNFGGKGIGFTSYSIEQVDFISLDFIQAIAQTPGLEAFLHIEPVGWQTFNLNSTHAHKFRGDLDFSSFEKKPHYNQNLISILLEAEARNIISIDYDISCINCLSHRANFPGSAIFWRPVKGLTNNDATRI